MPQTNMYVVDQYPAINASGVFLDDIIWVQFSQPINPDTATYYSFLLSKTSDYVSPDGTVTVHGVSGGSVLDSVIKFTPEHDLVRNTEYAVIVSTNIKSKVGDKSLAHEYTWYFTTGNTVAPSGISGITPTGTSTTAATVIDPTATGVLDNPLRVITTTPDDYATDQNRNLSFISVRFNGIIPSGINLYDKLSISSKQVLN